MLRVKRCKVKANGKIYVAGQNLPKLSKDDEKRLIDSEIAEEISVEKVFVKEPDIKPETEKDMQANKANEDPDGKPEENTEETKDDTTEGINIDLDLDDVVVEDKKTGNKKQSRK